jgi:hypothetical protein
VENIWFGKQFRRISSQIINNDVCLLSASKIFWFYLNTFNYNPTLQYVSALCQRLTYKCSNQLFKPCDPPNHAGEERSRGAFAFVPGGGAPA